MTKKLSYLKLLSLSLLIYYGLAFIPVIQKGSGEIFPFFSFKLFSKTPQNFTLYDCEICDYNQNCFLLLKNNAYQNEIQRKYFFNQIPLLLQHKTKNKQKFIANILKLYPNSKRISVVELKGDYLEAVNQNNYQKKNVLILKDDKK